MNAVVMRAMAVLVRSMRVRVHLPNSTRRSVSANSPHLTPVHKILVGLQSAESRHLGMNVTEETQLTSLAATAYHGFCSSFLRGR